MRAAACDTPDAVGGRIAGWLKGVGWRPLNTGPPPFTSYRSGSHTAPDIAACSAALARRATWSTGPDVGTDYLPVIVDIRATALLLVVALRMASGLCENKFCP